MGGAHAVSPKPATVRFAPPSIAAAKGMAELKTVDIQHIFPRHCGGSNFIDLAKKKMLGALVLCTIGSQFIFAA